MKFPLLKILLTFTYTSLHCQNIDQNENLVIKSLMNTLGIKSCVLVDDDYHSAIITYKYFTRQNIYTKFMDVDYFTFNVKSDSHLKAKTAVIMKSGKIIDAFGNNFTSMDFDYVMSRFTWIIMDKATNSLAAPFYVPYNCEFLIITPINHTYYQIGDIYNVGLTNDSRRQKSRLGFWSQGALTLTATVKEMRRYDMLGEMIFTKVDVLDTCAKAKESQRQLLHDCYHTEILSEIGRMMNSTVNFYVEEDLTYEKYSISTAHVRGMTYDKNFINPDLFGPIFSLTGYFYIKNDVGEKHGITLYLAPFSKEIWFYTFISLLTSSLAIFLIELGRTFPKCSIQKIFSSPIFVFQPLDALCNQSGSNIPKNASSRLIWLSIRISASILVPAYSAAIISFITISIPILPFSDLKTFLQDGTYKTSGFKGTYGHTFLQVPSDPVSKEVSEKLLLNNTPRNFTEAIKWICQKDFKYAFLGYNNDLYEIPDSECKIIKIPNPIFSVPTGLMMRSYSPYKTVYLMNLHRFYYSGVIQKMKNEIMGKMPEESKEDYIPLTINRIGPLFYIILIGNTLTSIIIFLEILKKKWASRASPAQPPH